MKVENIWKNVRPVGHEKVRQARIRYKAMNHQFEVIIAALDRVYDGLIVKGILKDHSFRSSLEVPKIVAQHLKGGYYWMDNTPENREILKWFTNKAKQMYDLEDKISNSNKDTRWS